MTLEPLDLAALAPPFGLPSPCRSVGRHRSGVSTWTFRLAGDRVVTVIGPKTAGPWTLTYDGTTEADLTAGDVNESLAAIAALP